MLSSLCVVWHPWPFLDIKSLIVTWLMRPPLVLNSSADECRTNWHRSPVVIGLNGCPLSHGKSTPLSIMHGTRNLNRTWLLDARIPLTIIRNTLKIQGFSNFLIFLKFVAMDFVSYIGREFSVHLKIVTYFFHGLHKLYRTWIYNHSWATIVA